ncbi:MAG: hypothetical protein KAQ68_10050, partial [Clostridiales bacterium]|nr:hypothetical protein [Clostridiales bacterium]
WVSGDDASDGTLIEDITDDTGHYEGVNRYEVTGLTNEMTYYFKVVPYVGAKENWIIGENEITCDAGRVLNHFTFESSGDADVGSYNFTNVGATFVSAEIGNALKITNDYLTANDFTPDEFTFLTEIILKASDTHPLLAESQEVGGGITYGWGFYVDGSGNLIIENWNGGNISTGRNIVTFTTDMSTDHKYTLEIYYKKSTKTVNAYLDGVFQSKSGGLFTTSHTSPVATRIGCRVKDFYGGDGNFEMLSAWIISGAMSAIDRANSINGGASL